MTETNDEREARAIARAFDMPGADESDDELADGYRDVLAQLTTEEIVPAPELEDQMVAAALTRRPAAARALDGARAKNRARARLAILGVTAVAAAVVIAFLLAGGSDPTGVPKGHIELSTSQAADVAALVNEPGVRIGTFSNNAGKVALAPSGQADAYGLHTQGPVVITLVSENGTSSLPAATPVDGVIGFGVDHPDRVVAITLSQNGREIARAPLP
jgi:hypothetical protein